jgi:integrase
MPRKVRDANLETRTARHRLAVRHKPYFRLIEPGLHLGYRRLNGPGTWLARRYVSDGRYVTENLRTADGALVLADDYADSDGDRILNFAQAQQATRGPRAQQSSGAYVVGDAVDDYLRFLANDGRASHSVRDTRHRVEAFIRPQLGSIKLSTLTTDRLRRWRDEVVKTPPRLRTKNGDKQKHRDVIGEDAKRARRASANRVWTTLRAALNHAFLNGKVESDLAWRKLKPFHRVEAARIRYLSVAEAKRLLNACDPDFRRLVQAALATGARYGELTALRASDFNPDSGTIHVRTSKSGKGRHIVLNDEGVALFSSLVAGKPGTAVLLTKADGSPWKSSHQARPMAEACERAKNAPPASFHVLRHTWASLAVMAGGPLMVVARNLGHSDTRMVEKHYGHLAPSYVADAIRAAAPKFGIKPERKVISLGARMNEAL